MKPINELHNKTKPLIIKTSIHYLQLMKPIHYTLFMLFLLFITKETFSQVQPYDPKRVFLPTLSKQKNIDSTVNTKVVSEAAANGEDLSLWQGAMEAKLPLVVMPSPNSAVLTRAISENVDLYTGKLTVNIPLYSLKSRNIEVPISLQALGNAHKVNDIGSWVGTGLSLNAGGVITRVMHNLPDEFDASVGPTINKPGIGFLNLQKKENINLQNFLHSEDIGSPAYTISQKKSIIEKGAWNNYANPPSKCYDLQPDEFYFNFGNYSGKFVFDQEGKTILTTASNIIIKPVIANGKITAFTAITDDGYTYEFGNYNLNAVEETKLKTKSESIQFSYVWSCVDKDAKGYTIFGYHSMPFVMSMQARPPQISSPEPTRSIPNGLVDFFYAHNKYDAEYFSYPSSWYLTKITSSTNDVVNFNYIDNGVTTYMADRSYSSSSPKFESFYAAKCRENTYWSYVPYATKLPSGDIGHYPTFADFTVTTSTIELKSKKLREIITSQGYKAVFNSFTQRSDFLGDKRLDNITIKKDNEVIKTFDFAYTVTSSNEKTDQMTFNYLRPVYYYEFQLYLGYGGIEASQTKVFDITPDMRARMFLTSIQEKGTNNEYVPPFTFEYNDINGLPFRTSNRQDKYGFANNNSTGMPLTSQGAIKSPSFSHLLAGVIKSITYPTGGHKEFTYGYSGSPNAWNGLRVEQIKEYENTNATPVTKTYTYGKFIDNDVAILSYEMPDQLFSGAVIGNKVLYSSGRVNPESYTKGGAGGYDFAEVSQPDNGKYRIEFTSNKNEPDKGNVTYLVSSFTNPEVINMNEKGYAYPFPMHNSYDYKRGLPIAEYVKDSNGKNIKSTHYEYDFLQNSFSASAVYHKYTGVACGLQVSKYRVQDALPISTVLENGWSWLLYGGTDYFSNWQFLKKKTERLYQKDGINYLENVQQNLYKAFPNYKKLANFLYLTETKSTTNSKKEELVEIFKYPLAYLNRGVGVGVGIDEFGKGLTMLESQNILSAPVEKYSYRQNPDGSNKRYIGGALNVFHAEAPLLKETYAFLPRTNITAINETISNTNDFSYDFHYIPVRLFSLYDAYGNIKQQSQNRNFFESYLWDYANTYPVAKVINAQQSDIAYTSFEAEGMGNWVYATDATSIVQSENAVTGNKYYSLRAFDKISSALLNTSKKYKLSLWCANGTPTVYKVTLMGSQLVKGNVLMTINGWQLFEFDIDNTNKVEIANTINLLSIIAIDELRLFPAEAQMTSFTFNPLVGMTSQCDANNRIVYYEYDGLQRLKLIKDEYRNVTKTFEYNYKK